MDTRRIAPAGDGIHAAGEQAQDRLLEAAQAALKLLDRIDQHAPEGLAFGGEGKVRKQLREAIKRSRLEADALAWADAESASEAEALDDLRDSLGHMPTDRERAAFLGGFREARAAHSR